MTGHDYRLQARTALKLRLLRNAVAALVAVQADPTPELVANQIRFTALLRPELDDPNAEQLAQNTIREVLDELDRGDYPTDTLRAMLEGDDA